MGLSCPVCLFVLFLSLLIETENKYIVFVTATALCFKTVSWCAHRVGSHDRLHAGDQVSLVFSFYSFLLS